MQASGSLKALWEAVGTRECVRDDTTTVNAPAATASMQLHMPHLDPPGAVHQQVGALKVAVDDAAAVQVEHALGRIQCLHTATQAGRQSWLDRQASNPPLPSANNEG